jgi:hypothetical protein
MAGLKDWTGTILLVVIVVAIVYLMDPTFFGLIKSEKKEKFQNMMGEEEEEDVEGFMTANGDLAPGQMENQGENDKKEVESNPHIAGFMNYEEEEEEGFENQEEEEEEGFQSAGAPAGCYAREQINPGELLPQESGAWSEQNPSGPGSLKGKNFLTAGSLIGVNTIGQSLKNASWDLRSEPANPQKPVSIFNNSTYQPDLLRRPLEIQ